LCDVYGNRDFAAAKAASAAKTRKPAHVYWRKPQGHPQGKLGRRHSRHRSCFQGTMDIDQK
jgi:hypothetical protein